MYKANIMEYIIELARNITNNLAGTEIIISVIIGAAFALFMGAIFVIMQHMSDPVQIRKNKLFGGDDNKKEGTLSIFAGITGPIASKVYLNKKTSELSKLKMKLIHAGFESEDSALMYYSTKILLALLMMGLTLILASIYPKYPLAHVLIGSMAIGFIGLIIPDYYLNHKVEKRKKEIMNGFPDALDLMVTCTEAGLGLNQTFQRVGEEIQMNYPELGKELAIVNAKIRAGMDRIDALRDLAERTGLDEIRGMVALLNQSIEFGTSIADMLRVFAEEFRDRRMQKAEEQAAKIGTKLLFPLVLCMFPVFFIVSIGPAILKVMKTFGKI